MSSLVETQRYMFSSSIVFLQSQPSAANSTVFLWAFNMMFSGDTHNWFRIRFEYSSRLGMGHTTTSSLNVSLRLSELSERLEELRDEQDVPIEPPFSAWETFLVNSEVRPQKSGFDSTVSSFLYFKGSFEKETLPSKEPLEGSLFLTSKPYFSISTPSLKIRLFRMREAACWGFWGRLAVFTTSWMTMVSNERIFRTVSEEIVAENFESWFLWLQFAFLLNGCASWQKDYCTVPVE